MRSSKWNTVSNVHQTHRTWNINTKNQNNSQIKSPASLRLRYAALGTAPQLSVKWALLKQISQEIKLAQDHLWNPLESHNLQYCASQPGRSVDETCKVVGHSLLRWPCTWQMEQIPPWGQSLVKWPGSLHLSQHLNDSKGNYVISFYVGGVLLHDIRIVDELILHKSHIPFLDNRDRCVHFLHIHHISE